MPKAPTQLSRQAAINSQENRPRQGSPGSSISHTLSHVSGTTTEMTSNSLASPAPEKTVSPSLDAGIAVPKPSGREAAPATRLVQAFAALKETPLQGGKSVLQTAQEFRRKGHNAQIPTVDPSLAKALNDEIDRLEKDIGELEKPREKSASDRQRESVGELKKLSRTDRREKAREALETLKVLKEKLSDTQMKTWIENEMGEVPSLSRIPLEERSLSERVVGGYYDPDKLGSREKAQSLVRRLEDSLRALTGVARGVGDIMRNVPVDTEKLTEETLSSTGEDREELEARSRSGDVVWEHLIAEKGEALKAALLSERKKIVSAAEHEIHKTNDRVTSWSASFSSGPEAFFEKAEVFFERSSNLLKASPLPVNLDRSGIDLLLKGFGHEVAKLEGSSGQGNRKEVIGQLKGLVRGQLTKQKVDGWIKGAERAAEKKQRSLKGKLFAPVKILAGMDKSPDEVAGSLRKRLENTFQGLTDVARTLNGLTSPPVSDAEIEAMAERAVLRKCREEVSQNGLDAGASLIEQDKVLWQDEVEKECGTIRKALDTAQQLELRQMRDAARRLVDDIGKTFGSKGGPEKSFLRSAHFILSKASSMFDAKLIPEADAKADRGTLQTLKKEAVALNQTAQAMGNKAITAGTTAIGKLPAKSWEERLADSAVRSLLSDIQQPILALQNGGKTLKTVTEELNKISEQFRYHEARETARQLGRDREGGQDKLVLLLEQEKPETKKLSALSRLLDKNINTARQAAEGMLPDGLTLEDMMTLPVEKLTRGIEKSLLKSLDSAAGGLGEELRAGEKWRGHLDAEVNKLKRNDLPAMAKELADTVRTLGEAVRSASSRDFATAEAFSELALLKAVKTNTQLSRRSASVMGRPSLDDNSRGVRLAAYLAQKLNETLKLKDGDAAPGVEEVLSHLEGNGLLEDTVTHNDPGGLLLAARIVKELNSIMKGGKRPETDLAGQGVSTDGEAADLLTNPLLDGLDGSMKSQMSPADFAKMQKDLKDYAVTWGQMRLTARLPDLIIEMAMDAATGCTFNLMSPLFRIPVATVTLAYSVHKAKSLTKAGQDRDYKAENTVIKQQLKLMGFNVITSPLPGLGKLALGAGLAGYGHAHNHMVDLEERTLDSIHRRLIEGEKSQKLKMATARELVVQTVLSLTSEGVEAAVEPVLEEAYLEFWDHIQEMKLSYSGIEQTEPYLGVKIIGDENYIQDTQDALDELADTEPGRKLLSALVDKGIEIRLSRHAEDGASHPYGSSVEGNKVFFDPRTPLTGRGEDVGNEPSIVLAHELLHLYYNQFPATFNLKNEETLTLKGGGNIAAEHMVSGIKYTHDDGTELDFSNPEFIQRHLPKGAVPLTENELCKALDVDLRLVYAEGKLSYEETIGDEAQFNRNSNYRQLARRAERLFNKYQQGDINYYKSKIIERLNKKVESGHSIERIMTFLNDQRSRISNARVSPREGSRAYVTEHQKFLSQADNLLHGAFKDVKNSRSVDGALLIFGEKVQSSHNSGLDNTDEIQEKYSNSIVNQFVESFSGDIEDFKSRMSSMLKTKIKSGETSDELLEALDVIHRQIILVKESLNENQGETYEFLEMAEDLVNRSQDAATREGGLAVFRSPMNSDASREPSISGASADRNPIELSDEGNQLVADYQEQILERLDHAYSNDDYDTVRVLLRDEKAALRLEIHQARWVSREELQVLERKLDLVSHSEYLFSEPGFPDVRKFFVPENTLESAQLYLHQRAIAKEVVGADDFLLKLITPLMSEELKEQFSGDNQHSILDQTVMVKLHRRDNIHRYGRDTEYKHSYFEKPFTLRQILNDEHTEYKRKNSPKPLYGYMEITGYSDPTPELENLAEELTALNPQKAFKDHIGGLKNNQDFMSSMEFCYNQMLDDRLEALGVSREGIYHVDLKVVSNGTYRSKWNSRDIGDHSLFAIKNTNGSLTFFSPMDDKVFTFGRRSEAEDALLDHDSEMSEWVRQYCDPKWQSYLDKERTGTVWSFIDTDHVDIFLDKFDSKMVRRNNESILDCNVSYMDMLAKSDGEQVGETILALYQSFIGDRALSLTEGIPNPAVKYLARLANAAIVGGAKIGLAESVSEQKREGTNMVNNMALVTTYTGTGSAAGKAKPFLGQVARGNPYIGREVGAAEHMTKAMLGPAREEKPLVPVDLPRKEERSSGPTLRQGGNDALEADAVDASENDTSIESVVDNVRIDGSAAFQAETRKAFVTLSKTEDGRAMLEALGKTKDGYVIRYAEGEDTLLREENGRKYYASSTAVEGRVIYFDPWNLLSAKNEEDIGDEAWRERDPSIALFHEMEHIYDDLSSDDFSSPADMPTQKLTENGYRQQFYTLTGEEPIFRGDQRHGSYDGRVGYSELGNIEEPGRQLELGEIDAEDSQAFQDYLKLGLIRDELNELKALLNSREAGSQADIGEVRDRLFTLREKLVGVQNLLEKKFGDSGVPPAKMPPWEIDSQGKASVVAGQLDKFADRLDGFSAEQRAELREETWERQGPWIGGIGREKFDLNAAQRALEIEIENAKQESGVGPDEELPPRTAELSQKTAIDLAHDRIEARQQEVNDCQQRLDDASAPPERVAKKVHSARSHLLARHPELLDKAKTAEELRATVAQKLRSMFADDKETLFYLDNGHLQRSEQESLGETNDKIDKKLVNGLLFAASSHYGKMLSEDSPSLVAGDNPEYFHISTLGGLLTIDDETQINTRSGATPVKPLEEIEKSRVRRLATELESGVPDSVEGSLPSLRWAYDKINSEPREAAVRLRTLPERYDELEQDLEKYSGITESQYDSNPDDPRYAEAREKLEGILVYLAYDYWFITGEKPELPEKVDGYAGLKNLMDTVNDLMVKLRGVGTLSSELEGDVDRDTNRFFQDKLSSLNTGFRYTEVFSSLREQYNNEISALEQSEDTVIDGVPKERLIQRARAKLLLVDQKELKYLDSLRSYFPVEESNSDEEVKEKAEKIYTFSLLENAKKKGFFKGVPGSSPDLALVTIILSSLNGREEYKQITLLEYLTSQEDYSDCRVTFPKEISTSDKLYIVQMREDIDNLRGKLNEAPMDYRFSDMDSEVKKLTPYLQELLDEVNEKHGTDLKLDDKLEYEVKINTANQYDPNSPTLTSSDTTTVREILLGNFEKIDKIRTVKVASSGSIADTVNLKFLDEQKNKDGLVEDLIEVDMQNEYINDLNETLSTSAENKADLESLISRFNRHVDSILEDLGFNDSEDKVYELETSKIVYSRFGSGMLYTERENGGDKANGLLLVELKSQRVDGKTPVVLVSSLKGDKLCFESMEDFRKAVDESEDQGNQLMDALHSSNELTKWIHAHLPNKNDPKYGIELREVQRSEIGTNIFDTMRSQLTEIADREVTSNGESTALAVLEGVKLALIPAGVAVSLFNPAIAVPLGIAMGAGPSFAQAAVADKTDEKEGYIIDGLIAVGAELGGQTAGKVLKGLFKQGSKSYRAFVATLNDQAVTGVPFRGGGQVGDLLGRGQGKAALAGSTQPRIPEGTAGGLPRGHSRGGPKAEGQGFRGNRRSLEDWGGNGGHKASGGGRPKPRYNPLKKTTLDDLRNPRRTNPAFVNQPRSYEPGVANSLFHRTKGDLTSVIDATTTGGRTTTQPGVWQFGAVLARAAGL